ncbi:MAG: translation initiation factor IF-2 [Dehalococcoidia bacterium]
MTTKARQTATPTKKSTTAASKKATRPATPVLELPETVTVKRLAELLQANPVEVIKLLMRNGIMAAINQAISLEVATRVAQTYGYRVKQQQAPPSMLDQLLTTQEGDPSQQVTRPPVVTILGHVDHGKTTLLDAIRQTRVAEREAGGITQHIGAYQVEYKGQAITFIDTPGHEAFTAMRARGAQVTDIAVLVVAADDGVMPQTVEALNHARAAKVPIVVAINKVDKPEADVDQVKRQLGEQGLVLEEWGGEVIAVPVSAKAGQGIEDLLENILVVAEVSELKANPQQPARGVVLESRLDKSRGPVATVLVEQGTLKVGDSVVAGSTWGRVKAMTDDAGKRTREPGPSRPVELLGLSGVAEAGDTLLAVSDERTARTIVAERQKEKTAEGARARALTLEDLSTQVTTGEVHELGLILKTDVQGSIDAVRNALAKLETTPEQVKLRILHAGTGTITESDVLLAVASKAVIIGFNTSVEPGARRMADTQGIQIRLYSIIYQLVDDMEKALQGMLKPRVQEVVEGRAEVLALFPLGKGGKVAGCIIRDGHILRGAPVRVLRQGEVVHEGTISSLRHYKENVTELAAGFECGIALEGFSDFEVSDTLEVYRRERLGAAAS